MLRYHLIAHLHLIELLHLLAYLQRDRVPLQPLHTCSRQEAWQTVCLEALCILYETSVDVYRTLVLE